MDVQACRFCLSTETKLYEISKIETHLDLLVRTPSSAMSAMFPTICYLCVAQLMKFNKFRTNCFIAQSLFEEIWTKKGLLNLEDITSIQAHLKPLLSKRQIETINISSDTELLTDNQLNSDPYYESNVVVKVEEETNDNFDQLEHDVFDNTETPLENNELDNTKYFHTTVFEAEDESVETDEILMDGTKVTKGKPHFLVKTRKRLRSTKKQREKSYKPQRESTTGIDNLNNSDNQEGLTSEVVDETRLQGSNVTIVRPQKKLEDYIAFAQKYNMKVKLYSKEEQMSEIASRKETDSYKSARLKCDICFKGLTSNTAFKNHQNAHTSARGPFSCDLCHMYFNKKGARDKHTEEHAVKYTCVQCGETFTNQCLAVYHFEFHSGVQFKCEVCDIVYRKRTTYANHIRNRHANVSCSLCGDSFVGDQGLMSHMLKSHRESSKCLPCGVVFVNEDALKIHQEESCRPDLKACVHCGLGFTSDKELTTHVNDRHRKQKTISCELCTKTFWREHALTEHWHRCHNGKTRNRTRDRATRSRSSADNPKGYICDKCGKCFKAKQHFQCHWSLHTGEKPYQCSICPKTFRVNSSLKAHVLTHTDERPFKCSVCPRAFRQSSHRINHMRTHTMEKPYSCSICDKRFSIAANEREHTRTVHEGLPPRRRRNKHVTIK